MTLADAIRARQKRGDYAAVALKDVGWLVETVNLLKLALAHQRYRNHEFKESCDGCRLNADALARLEAPDA